MEVSMKSIVNGVIPTVNLLTNQKIRCSIICPVISNNTKHVWNIHNAENPYLFDNAITDPMGSGKIVGTDECEFRHFVKEMWVNFARTGDPCPMPYFS